MAYLERSKPLPQLRQLHRGETRRNELVLREVTTIATFLASQPHRVWTTYFVRELAQQHESHLAAFW